MAFLERRSNGTVLERVRTLQRRPTARTLQRRPTLPPAKRGERVQDTFTAYDDFPWAKIEEFLGRRFPHWDFRPRRFNDKWVFEVPEQLTDDDRRELRNRRDAPRRTRRTSTSPEPEPESQAEPQAQSQPQPQPK